MALESVANNGFSKTTAITYGNEGSNSTRAKMKVASQNGLSSGLEDAPQDGADATEKIAYNKNLKSKKGTIR